MTVREFVEIAVNARTINLRIGAADIEFHPSIPDEMKLWGDYEVGDIFFRELDKDSNATVDVGLAFDLRKVARS